jgi:hypothetical protein
MNRRAHKKIMVTQGTRAAELLPIWQKVLKMIILLEEVIGDMVGGSGKRSNISIGCKEKYSIHLHAPEKKQIPISFLKNSLCVN